MYGGVAGIGLEMECEPKTEIDGVFLLSCIGDFVPHNSAAVVSSDLILATYHRDILLTYKICRRIDGRERV